MSTQDIRKLSSVLRSIEIIEGKFKKSKHIKINPFDDYRKNIYTTFTIYHNDK